jgi:ribokinase
MGTVGGDPEGGWILRGLQDEGVDCRQLQVDPAGTSQLAFIVVEAGSGCRNIFWKRGACRPFSFSSSARQAIAQSRVLLLDGLDEENSIRAARQAREAGVTTLLDGGSLRPGSTGLLPLIDHLVVSEKFARQFTGQPDPQAALAPLAVHGAAVTVTAGAGGSWSLIDGQAFQQPAFPVTAVDTTGCGDVFHGGYVFGLLQGWPLPQIVRFAAACAALKTRSLGGRTAIAGLDETLAFLQQETHE